MTGVQKISTIDATGGPSARIPIEDFGKYRPGKRNAGVIMWSGLVAPIGYATYGSGHMGAQGGAHPPAGMTMRLATDIVFKPKESAERLREIAEGYSIAGGRGGQN